MPQTVLIVGASRGLGLALALEWLKRGWDVIATIRGDASPALREASEKAGGRLMVGRLEMTDPEDVRRLGAALSGRRLDVLFVNAGVANGPGDRVDQISTEEFTRIMVTNALSPMRVVEALGPLVAADGTIAAMSSKGCGAGHAAGKAQVRTTLLIL